METCILDEMAIGDKLLRYHRQEVLSKRRWAAYASYYEEESVEVCKEKSITVKVNGQQRNAR